MPAPKRRWFAYSLRTLFVVMTVFACWLGYQLNWIRQRHNAKIGFGYLQIATTGPIPCHAPWPLRWFGEEGHGLLLVPDSYTKEEMDRIQALFPEAEVIDRIPVPADFVWPVNTPQS